MKVLTVAILLAFVVGLAGCTTTQKGAAKGPRTLDDVLGAGRLVYDATSVWQIQATQDLGIGFTVFGRIS